MQSIEKLSRFKRTMSDKIQFVLRVYLTTKSLEKSYKQRQTKCRNNKHRRTNAKTKQRRKTAKKYKIQKTNSKIE